MRGSRTVPTGELKAQASLVFVTLHEVEGQFIRLVAEPAEKRVKIRV
jgi:hypothetical protein